MTGVERVVVSLLPCFAGLICLCLPLGSASADLGQEQHHQSLVEPVADAESGSSSNSSDGVTPFIIGGRYAATNQFPQIVNVQWRNSRWCGGAILDRNWVLTAAHCVHNRAASEIAVLAGTTDTEGGQGVRVRAADIRVHSGYRASGAGRFSSFLPHDVALIRLQQSLPLGNSIRIAPLQQHATRGGERVVIAGWGQHSTTNTATSRTLKYADLLVVPNRQCEAALGSTVGQDQICAAAPNKDQKSCPGDSGGPLMHNGFVVGLVSYSGGCAYEHPTVYASVFHHLSWIRQQTGLNV